MEGKPLSCTIRPPVVIGVVDGSSDFFSGCTVVDIAFPKVASVDIEEIHFKNYYVAYLKLLARFRQTTKSPEGKTPRPEWKTVVPLMHLMPHPHCEESSEDYFVIHSAEMRSLLRDVTELRFVLQQPSPQWKDFKIEEVQLYGLSETVSSESVQVPSWLSEFAKDGAPFRDDERQLKGVSSVSELSKRLQKLWELTVEARMTPPNNTLGRYDVDGCYDVNVLSYT